MHRILLEVDDDDYRAINEAIAKRQLWRTMPDAGGNVAGRVIAEICRGWLELRDHLNQDGEGEEWKS